MFILIISLPSVDLINNRLFVNSINLNAQVYFMILTNLDQI